MKRMKFFFTLALLTLPASAQFSAAIQGTVLDPSQAAVPNARLTLTNDATGIAIDTISTGAGFYRFSSLAPGAYEIKVTVRQGTTAVVQESVFLTIES